MGSLTLAYPSIAGKTTQEQLESMRRYLCSVTEQLNLADWSAKAALTEIAQVIDADGLPEEEKKTTLSGYAALKSLIIKTADFAAANSETWSAKLSGSYVAISDFGGLVGEACGELCRGVGLRDVSGKDAADDRGKLRRN